MVNGPEGSSSEVPYDWSSGSAGGRRGLATGQRAEPKATLKQTNHPPNSGHWTSLLNDVAAAKAARRLVAARHGRAGAALLRPGERAGSCAHPTVQECGRSVGAGGNCSGISDFTHRRLGRPPPGKRPGQRRDGRTDTHHDSRELWGYFLSPNASFRKIIGQGPDSGVTGRRLFGSRPHRCRPGW
jgi:hypothetical protein